IGQRETVAGWVKVEIVGVITGAVSKISKRVSCSRIRNGEPKKWRKNQEDENRRRDSALTKKLQERQEWNERPRFEANTAGESCENSRTDPTFLQQKPQ